MSRYSKEHKEQTRRMIVRTAASTLRGEGIAGAGVGEIMGRAGLTHGGFYAHFASKDELVEEACVAGVVEAGERLLAIAEQAPLAERIHALLDAYLTRERRDSAGCTIATLGSELARQPPSVRDAFTRALHESLEHLAATMPDGDAEARFDQVLALISGMIGAMMLARAVSDPELSDRFLDVGRRAVEGAVDRVGGRAARKSEEWRCDPPLAPPRPTA
jgi:TetR/AcrR family transcriptional repressor of nem operon